MDDYFINQIASRFLRHLGSIERLLEQDLAERPKPSEMELGEFVHYILHLKFKKIEATKKEDKDEIKDIDNTFSELSSTSFFKVINEKVNIYEEDDAFSYEIDSAMLRKAYNNYLDNRTDESYDVSQYQNSLIVSLVIGLEILIADIFKDYIHNLDVSNQVIKEKTLTFDDLKNFDSVEDAKVYLLDQYIENLLRNSFDGWLMEFESKMKINVKKIDELKVEINLINETLQRRHLIIHNDGIVNDLYIKKVDPKLSSNVIKGEGLELDPQYIKSRIKTFRKFGLILIYLYGSKKHKSNLNAFFMEYHGLLVNILDKGCGGVRYIFESFSETDIDYGSKLMSKINYFLTYKLINEKTIDKEIEEFETSALSVEYRMAKSILLEQEDSEKLAMEFFKINSDDSFIGIIEWPLIRLLKKTPKVNSYIKRRLNNIIDKEMRNHED